MSHPFGDLLWQHLIRKRGLSQNKLAMGVNQDPAVIARMCNGKALTGQQARERIVQIAEWLHEQGVLGDVGEANALLIAADKPGLNADQPKEAQLLQSLETYVDIAGNSSNVAIGIPPTPAHQAGSGQAGAPNTQQTGIPPCPFRGLFAFREEDADYFCGREVFTETLVEAVKTQRKPLVAVIGSSGSGKSSVVFAGLAPRLREAGGWLIASFRPGDHPFNSLAAVLVPYLEPKMGEIERLVENNRLAEAFKAGKLTLLEVVNHIIEKNHPAKHLLLVSDQFEELYTLCKDAAERQAFLDLLLAAVATTRSKVEQGQVPNLSVVATLRADFLGPALAYRPLVDALQGTDLKLGSMTRQELQEAIEAPSQRQGVAIEEGLTKRILDAVSDEPGDLPLLEFALTLLWARQRNRTLTHAAYDEIGGVEKALAGYAEERYGELSEQEQQRAQHIFLQLVQPGEATEDTRRLASREEVREENWDLVTRLANDRLVVSDRDEATGEDTVEIVHEALIGGWDRLKQWVEADREFRTWQERMRAALHQWEQSGKDEGALLRGVPLAEAEQWLNERPNDLSHLEDTFIEAGISFRERESQEEETRKEHEVELAQQVAGAERRAANRLRYLASALALFGLIAALLSAWAFRSTQEAIQSKKVADEILTESQAVSWADEARLQTQGSNDLIALLSIRSLTKKYTEQGDIILGKASMLGYPNQRFIGHGSAVVSLTFSPDGKRALTGSWDTTARLWDVATGEQIGEPFTHTGRVRGTVFPPISDTIITASSTDHAVRMWNIADNIRPRWLFTDHKEAVVALAISPDGKRLITGSEDKTAWLVDAASGKGLFHLQGGHTSDILSVAFSPDREGKYALTGSNDGTARLWDAHTGVDTGKVFTATDSILSVAFSPPDGQYVLTGGQGGSLQLWNVQSGNEVSPDFVGQTGTVQGVAFSPDGKYIVSGSDDGIVRLWETATRKELRRFTGVAEEARGVTSVAFSPDGRSVLIGGGDSIVRLWYIDTKPNNIQFIGHTDAVQSAVFSGDGRRVLTTSSDDTARIWEAATGRETISFTQHTDGLALGAFSPDGKMALTGSFQKDGTARLWDTVTGQQIISFPGYTKGERPEVVYGIAFSKDGKKALTAGWNHKALMWDVSGKTPPVVFEGHIHEVFTAVFSPDEQRVLTAGADDAAWLWDLKGNKLHKFEHPSGGLYSAVFSHDGKYVLTASSDHKAYLWKATEPWDPKPIRSFEGHEALVQSARFSADDKLVLTASADKTAKLWDAETGSLLRTFAGHTAGVESAEFSPDGKRILTASDDGTARLWDIDYHTTLDYLCGRLGGLDFTDEERKQYKITNADNQPDNTSTCPALTPTK